MQNDIPEAQRQQVPSVKRKTSPWTSMSIFGLFAVGGLFLLGLGWLVFRGSNSPSQANISGNLTPEASDLFGHLPFPEVPRDDLISLEIAPGIKLHQSAAIAFDQMVRDASADGIGLVALSGFRTEEEQEALFFEVKKERNQVASKRAEVSAPPGYSEHHTGYAVDIGDADNPDTHVEVEFGSTEAFEWLSQNAARYSFELSFPEGNEQGVSYEPWHWRFVGTQTSLEIFHKGR